MLDVTAVLFPVGQQHYSDLGWLTVEVSRSHTIRYTQNKHDSSGRVISPSHRPLPTYHITITRDEHSCPPAGLEPTIPAIKMPQTYALDCTATGIGQICP